MFKFHKVRGPEQVGDAISTLEETANRLESIVEVAQKEKSRLNLLVGNVTDRVDQIKQSASGFDQIAEKIESFQNRFKIIEDEIKSIQQQANGLKELKGETGKLVEQFEQLKSEFQSTTSKLQSYNDNAKQLEPLNEKAEKIKESLLPEINSIGEKQTELLKRYNEYIGKLDGAETKLQGLVKLSQEFKQTSENVAQESARLTTWMEATESISKKLEQATEVFDTTKQKIDNLHELAEYVENKVKSLKKQKELLKKAHIESGRANGLFWEIKSKLNELEQDTDKVRKMEMRTAEFDASLKRIEGRFEHINSFVKKVDQVLAEYVRLEQYARLLLEHRKQLGVVDELVKQIAKHIELAKDERTRLAEAEKQMSFFLKRSEESQNESRSIIRKMTELMQSSEQFMQRAPDVNKALTQIESIRKRALALENKLMEAMATTTEIKDQTQKADEVKKAVEQFNLETDKKIDLQKKELTGLNNSLINLKNNLDTIQANWSKVPQLMEKLADVEKMQQEVDKTYKSVIQREQAIGNLKNLMEQNIETFRQFEKTSSDIHQKATEILNVKSELESIDYKVKSLSAAAKQLNMMGERMEKTESEMGALTENFTALNKQVKEWKSQADSMQTECESINKSHDNLRTNMGEVMDLFTKLSELRTQAESGAKKLSNHFQQAEQKVKELAELNTRSTAESGRQLEKLDEINDAIKMVNANQDELIERFNVIESEAAKIASLGNMINEKQSEMDSLNKKFGSLEGKIAEAENMQQRIEGFEESFARFSKEMDNISVALTKMEDMNKQFEGYCKQIKGFEQKINDISGQAKQVAKLRKDLNQASLIAEELKARQNSLQEEKDLINKAITAASKLEELVYRAEHINKQKK